MSKLAEHDQAYADAVTRAKARYANVNKDRLVACLTQLRESAKVHGMTHEIVAACEVIYDLMGK
jgi:hypothetical protein